MARNLWRSHPSYGLWTTGTIPLPAIAQAALPDDEGLDELCPDDPEDDEPADEDDPEDDEPADEDDPEDDEPLAEVPDGAEFPDDEELSDDPEPLEDELASAACLPGSDFAAARESVR